MFSAADDIVGTTQEPETSCTAACGSLAGSANRDSMDHPQAIRPQDYAVFNPEKMGKSTIFESERIMVGLNSFDPGQEHKLHAHAGMDKVYHVLEGSGVFVLEDREIEMEAGIMLIAPEGVPHGIRNTGSERLVVLAVLAPKPT